jgi:hypothetical protein
MKKDWKWLPMAMPGVAKLLAQKRAECGAEHVAACWKQGVVHEVPGHFFAAEGALTIGAPTAAQALDWYEPTDHSQRPEAVLHLAPTPAAAGPGHVA